MTAAAYCRVVAGAHPCFRINVLASSNAADDVVPLFANVDCAGVSEDISKKRRETVSY